ncbi:MAG: hypothetical protein ACLPSF_09630 [Methylocella sp.]
MNVIDSKGLERDADGKRFYFSASRLALPPKVHPHHRPCASRALRGRRMRTAARFEDVAMLAHFFHFIDAQAALLPHAPDVLRFAGREAAARPLLIRAAASAGRNALRLPLALPDTLRDFLLAWLASVALHFAPQLGERRPWRDASGPSGRSLPEPALLLDPDAREAHRSDASANMVGRRQRSRNPDPREAAPQRRA